MPAHVTLLYPFVEPARLDRGVRSALASVAAGSAPIHVDLAGAGRWPDSVYAVVRPSRPLADLQAALQASFPQYPIYDAPSGFTFVPHVTVAARVASESALDATLGDPAWQALPSPIDVDAIEVIARRDDGRWRTVWRIPLGRSGQRTRD